MPNSPADVRPPESTQSQPSTERREAEFLTPKPRPSVRWFDKEPLSVSDRGMSQSLRYTDQIVAAGARREAENIPPTDILPVSGLRVMHIQPLSGKCRVTLLWDDPREMRRWDPIYDVYIEQDNTRNSVMLPTRIGERRVAALQLATSGVSPVTVEIPCSEKRACLIRVVTRLGSGITMSVDDAPSVVPVIQPL